MSELMLRRIRICLVWSILLSFLGDRIWVGFEGMSRCFGWAGFFGKEGKGKSMVHFFILKFIICFEMEKWLLDDGIISGIIF